MTHVPIVEDELDLQKLTTYGMESDGRPVRVAHVRATDMAEVPVPMPAARGCEAGTREACQSDIVNDMIELSDLRALASRIRALAACAGGRG